MALFPRRFPLDKLYEPEGKVGFLSGVDCPNWFAWQAGSFLGIVLAGQIPQSWGIGFAGTLALLGMIAIALLLLASLITRCVAFYFSDRLRLAPLVQHCLRYAPAAAMAAIVLPDLVLAPGGLPYLSWHNPKFLAGLVAILCFLATRHMFLTIAVGRGLFTILRLVLET